MSDHEFDGLGPDLSDYISIDGTVDLSQDGVTDTIYGHLRTGELFAVMDSDTDSLPDYAMVDSDGDGQVDMWAADLGEGRYGVQVDTDGDGRPDEQTIMTRDELAVAAPGLLAALVHHLTSDGGAPPPEGDGGGGSDGDSDSDGGSDTDGDDKGGEGETPLPGPGADGYYGDPHNTEHWFQQAENGTCLPASIAQIVSEYTGVEYGNEAAFVQLATEMGMFDPNHPEQGMSPEDGADVLDAAGVPATYTPNMSLAELALDLESGRGVICIVDSGEIWYGESTEDNTADHAVVVTAIDVERQTVILSDPGAPGGEHEEVPLGLFLNAWADSGNAAIVCDEPAPEETSGGTGSSAVDSAVHSEAGWVLLPKLGGISEYLAAHR